MVTVCFLLLWSFLVSLPEESLTKHTFRQGENGDIAQQARENCHLPTVALSFPSGYGASLDRADHHAVSTDGAVTFFQAVVFVPHLHCLQADLDCATLKRTQTRMQTRRLPFLASATLSDGKTRYPFAHRPCAGKS